MSRLVRTLRRLVNQDVARANAAGASADLRKRRSELDDADDYLRALARGREYSSRGAAVS